MDVQCERCKAEYEFDDALVSGRGTTVKCTSCGHQFKIRRGSERPDDAAPDRWLVRTTEGRELVFTSLRELQKAILARQVGRADALVRGDGPARGLGLISELESFFEEASSASIHGPDGVRPEGAPRRTMGSYAGPMPGSGSMPRMVSSRPPPPMASRSAPALRAIAGTTPSAPPVALHSNDQMRPRIDTIRPPSGAPAVPPPSTRPGMGALTALTDDSSVGPAPQGASVSVAPVLSAGHLPGMSAPIHAPDMSHGPSTTGITEHTPPMPVHVHGTAPPLPARASNRPFNTAPPLRHTSVSAPAPVQMPPNRPPPPTIQVLDETATVANPLPAPTVPVKVVSSYRDSVGSLDDASDLGMQPPPRRIGGWLVGLMLLVGAGVIGFAVAKPYLSAKAAQTAAGTSALDPRASQALTDGERAMSVGDLDSANDDFVKAGALAENNPRVLVDLARLANVRADVPWLRAKLLPPDVSDDAKNNKSQLDELTARARKSADQAVAAAPELAAATLVKIDALRLSDDPANARALVMKVASNGSQSETAYVLAGLDLGDAQPLWPMVIERLRIAASAEGDAGRARGALVYALARSGDQAGARTELDKLAGLPRPSPLLAPLRAFIARGPEGADAHGAKNAGVAGPKAMAGMATSTATVDVSALPHASAGKGGGGNPNDPRVLLQQAESAKEAHDWDRARTLYSAALARNAGDSEALAGLGDCDRATHNLPGAATFYHRALAVNPVYLPALVGLGDVEWDSGDRDEAQKTYHDITDRFPEGVYPVRVKQRSSDNSGGIETPAPAPTNAAASPAASASGDGTGAQ